MFNLPLQTFYNKRVAKDKLATQLHLSASIRREFFQQVNAVYWAYKLAEETLHLPKGKEVTEIEVFHLVLNQKALNPNILQQFDKSLPYHTLFVLEYDGQAQAWIAFKVKDGSHKAYFSVKQYYHTAWIQKDNLAFTLAGITLDNVYENLVQAIAGEQLPLENGKKLADRVEKAIISQQLQEKINKLNQKIAQTKQFNRQVELSTKVRELEQILKGL